MSEPKFFISVLEPVEPENVLMSVYPLRTATQMSLEERLPGCTCEDCGAREWIILPKQSAAVRESGKPYIECMRCGHLTHL